MILTVCCNPCIDSYLYVDKLTPKSLNRISDTYSCIGGKGINVAKAINALGVKALASGLMGDEHDDLFSRELNALGIRSDFTLFPGKTRTNYKVNDKDGSITELNEKSLIDSKYGDELIRNLKSLSKDCDFIVLSGSLPSGFDDKYYEKVVKNIILPFAIDAEKGKILPTLSYHPEIIKPNIHELEDIIGKKLDTIEEIKSGCLELIKMGAKRVLASMGGDGAMLVDEKEAFFAQSPKVEVLSTVGAGDTMLSAAVVEIAKGSNNASILKSAVAAGTAAVMSKGTNALNIDDYNSLLPQIKIQKI